MKSLAKWLWLAILAALLAVVSRVIEPDDSDTWN